MACAEPYLKILTFFPGADPYFGPNSDTGHSWFSCLPQEHKFGTYSYNTTTGIAGVGASQPVIEYIGVDRMRTVDREGEDEVPIGLVLRPFIAPRDLGTWNEMTGNQGRFSYARIYYNPPVTHLLQTNPGVNTSGTTTNTVWGAESQETHPEEASFGFTIAPVEVTPEYNALTGGIPYFQVGWSGGLWAIRFFHRSNPVLMKRVGGVQIPVMELASPDRISYGDDQDLIVGIVRYQRGAIMVSFDHGATYDVWREPAGALASMPEGKFQFSGQGCACALGIHGITYRTGTYDSPSLTMDRSRAGHPSIDAVYGNEPTNSDLAVASIASLVFGSTSEMQYRATLTPGTITHSGRTYYTSPELYAVELSYAITPSFFFPIHDFGLTFEGRIKNCVIDKPNVLSEGTATWTTRYTVEEGGIIGNFALRKVQIWGGNVFEDGSSNVMPLFTGYITSISVRQINSVLIEVTFIADNVCIRPKRMQWRDSNAVPYDNRTANQALLKWAQSMGLNASYCYFDGSGRGDIVRSPVIYPEKQTHMPVAGESRWPLMEEIALASRLELGSTNDGLLAIVPNDQWNPTVWTWAAQPDDETFSDLERIEMGQDVLGTFTGVICRAKGMWGEQLARWVYDEAAETNILYSGFRPWPEWHVETVDRPVSGSYLSSLCAGLAYEKMTPRKPVRFQGELAPFLSRRDAVWITGATVGGGSIMRVGVESYRHVFDKSTGRKAWTEVEGRLL